MSQQPPQPPPPPQAPPPYQPQPPVAGGSGMEPRLASTLSYALWWITGIIFVAIEKDPEVKFHAWQSIAFFGAVTVLRIGLGFIGAIMGSLFLGIIFGLLNLVITIGAVVIWIVIMIQTYQGNRMVLPIAGPFAAQQAGITL